MLDNAEPWVGIRLAALSNRIPEKGKSVTKLPDEAWKAHREKRKK